MINKTIFLSVAFVSGLMSSTAHADRMQSILECSQISSDAVRLACFDAAAKDMLKGAGGLNTSKSATSHQEDIVDNFGKSQLRSSPLEGVKEKEIEAQENSVDEITLKVVRSIYTGMDNFVLFMENGQVWKQKDGGRVRLPDGEFEVKIKKGMIGGFNMSLPTKKSIIKVERLK